MIGGKEDKIIGNTVGALVDKSESVNMKNHLKQVLKTGEEDLVETKLKKPNKESISREIQTCLVYDIDDQPILLCRFYDISVKKEMSAALRQKRLEMIKYSNIMTACLKISRIQTESLDFESIIERSLPLFGRMFYANVVIASNLHTQADQISPTHQWGLTKEGFESYIALTADHDKQMLLSSTYEDDVVFCEDIEDPEETKDISKTLLKFLSSIGSKSCAIIPIIYDQDAVDMIVLSFNQKRTLASSENNLIHFIKNSVERSYKTYIELNQYVIEKADYEQQLELTRVIKYLGNIALASSSIEQVAHGAVRSFGQFMNTKVVEFLEVDEHASLLMVSGKKHGSHLDFTGHEIFNFRDMKTIVRMKMNQTAYIGNLETSALSGIYEKHFLEYGCHSLLIIPIFSKDVLMGMVALGGESTASFSKHHIEIAKRIVSEISVAFSEIRSKEKLKTTMAGVVTSLANTLDAKSRWTEGHSRRVSEYSAKLGVALALGEDDLYNLKLAALFHDLGKIGTYDDILDKQEKLSDEEYSAIKEHPKKTHEILAPIPELYNIGQIAMHHHERWDGNGYPEHLMGEQIPYLSRIICITDSFDAMTSDRPYRKGLGLQDALRQITNSAGKQFDPDVAAIFIEIMEDKADEKRTDKAA